MFILENPRELKIEDLNHSGIPKRYFEANINQLDQEKPYTQSINKYIKSFKSLSAKGTGLLFIGDYGTGKTHIACAILKYLISIGCSCLFITANDLKNSVIKESDLISISELKRIDVLLIDDFGSEYINDWYLSELESIIRHRYNNKKINIITSNLIPFDETKTTENRIKTIRGEYRDSVYTILSDSLHIIPIVGKNWRINKWN